MPAGEYFEFEEDCIKKEEDEYKLKMKKEETSTTNLFEDIKYLLIQELIVKPKSCEAIRQELYQELLN